MHHSYNSYNYVPGRFLADSDNCPSSHYIYHYNPHDEQECHLHHHWLQNNYYKMYGAILNNAQLHGHPYLQNYYRNMVNFCNQEQCHAYNYLAAMNVANKHIHLHHLAKGSHCKHSYDDRGQNIRPVLPQHHRCHTYR